MEGSSSLVRAVGKMASAGEQAGFSLEQMIELLNGGLSVETLLNLDSWRLGALQDSAGSLPCSSGWISSGKHAPWEPQFDEELQSGNC